MSGQKEFSFTYEGDVSVPFSDLKNDPTLVLKNLPRVETIEKIDEDDFRVTTTEYSFHGALSIRACAHVHLSVEGDALYWKRSQHEDTEHCNGAIVGEASSNNDGTTHISGEIIMRHPMLSPITWAFVKGTAVKIGEQFIREFIDNFNDPVIENSIPG